LGPIGSAVLTFIGYKQTDKQTNKQTDKPNLYIDRYRAPKNSSASAIWLAAENIQKVHLFLFSKLAKV